MVRTKFLWIGILLSVAVAAEAEVAQPAGQTPAQKALADGLKLSSPQGAIHDPRKPASSSSGPVRWVCVSRMKNVVNGKGVSAETVGSIGADCASVQRQALVDLAQKAAVNKSGVTDINPRAYKVSAADAEIFCR